MKDIKDYKGKKYAIQCKTQEEWDKITELLNYKWNRNNWGIRKEESCISTFTEGATQKSSYISAGYEILQASDFLQPTFKFNIGDTVNGKEGGWQFCNPESKDALKSIKSIKFSFNDIVVNRKYTNNTNWYKLSDGGNWITEEGLELVKEENFIIPEYVECTRSSSKEYVVGKIYQVENESVRTESGYLGNKKLPKNLLNHYNNHDFKPSTKQQYENQQLMNKHNLVVGKYYTYTNSANRTYWFRFKEVINNYLYSSGFRTNYLDKTWKEEDTSLFYLENHIFTEIAEQKAKGIVEKKEEWIPKVGDWVVWLNSISNAAYKVIKLNSDSFFVESDGEEFRYIRPIKELCRKALPHEIPNNIPDSNTQYWECTEYLNGFTKGKIYKLNKGKSINDTYAFIDNSGEENGHYPYNQKYFKPSTEAAYNAQNQIVKQNVAVISTGTYFETWTNNGYTTINYSFKGNTPNINTPTTITIKDRTKKEEKSTKTRTKLTFLKPKSITI